MDNAFEFNTLLVPTDFSPESQAAFEYAMKLAKGEDASVIVLHVIDSSLIDFAERHGLASKEKAVEQVRTRVEELIDQYQPVEGLPVNVTKMICEGTPFLQIIEHARDLLVDAVVLTKAGSPHAIEKMLFGSTAEKVIRGCAQPVIVLPIA